MPLRRGNFRQLADAHLVVAFRENEAVVEEVVEEKPKRGPGRPKKADAVAEVEQGTTAEND